MLRAARLLVRQYSLPVLDARLLRITLSAHAEVGERVLPLQLRLALSAEAVFALSDLRLITSAGDGFGDFETRWHGASFSLLRLALQLQVCDNWLYGQLDSALCSA